MRMPESVRIALICMAETEATEMNESSNKSDRR